MKHAVRWLACATVTVAAAGAPAMATASPGGAPSSSQAHGGVDPQLSKRGVEKVCGGLADKKLEARCQAKILTVKPGSSTAYSTNAPVGLGADDLARAYELPATSTGTKTIAILDGGRDFNLDSDLANYRYMYRLPQCTKANGCLKEVYEDGGKPLGRPKTDDEKLIDDEIAVETSLDVDMASAACPTCHILMIDVNRASMVGSVNNFAKHMTAGVKTAIKLGASAVSMSYQAQPTKYADTGNPAKVMNHKGVAILASSGDSGTEGSPAGWPQNLSSVISVGGTSLYNSSSSPTGYVEQAWSDAGSGCSGDIGPAIGQPKDVSDVCGGKRAASDVSAIADPYTGVAVYDTYSPYYHEPYNWIVVGGTSASAPFIGGLFARGGNVSGVHGPNTIYAHAGDFYDVTVGQNAPQGGCKPFPDTLCVAGSGWDGPTGVGAPRGLTPFG